MRGVKLAQPYGLYHNFRIKVIMKAEGQQHFRLMQTRQRKNSTKEAIISKYEPQVEYNAVGIYVQQHLRTMQLWSTWAACVKYNSSETSHYGCLSRLTDGSQLVSGVSALQSILYNLRCFYRKSLYNAIVRRCCALISVQDGAESP